MFNDFFMISFKVGEKEFDNIKNVIFDLGGVIVNIDYNATSNAFKQLGVANIDEIFSQRKQTPLFDNYEKGLISPTEFMQGLRNTFNLKLSDEEIKHAWNAMILDQPTHRLETLKKMKLKYRTFLLSNTNEGHLEYYFKQVSEKNGVINFSSLFETAYFSCRMGMRKPDVEIFNKVLELSALNPQETIFLEDLPQNIAGAISAGIQTYQIIPGKDDITDLLKNNY
jgi:epoxide hydrolase-like predicted phosphatase